MWIFALERFIVFSWLNLFSYFYEDNFFSPAAKSTTYSFYFNNQFPTPPLTHLFPITTSNPTQYATSISTPNPTTTPSLTPSSTPMPSPTSISTLSPIFSVSYIPISAFSILISSPIPQLFLFLLYSYSSFIDTLKILIPIPFYNLTSVPPLPTPSPILLVLPFLFLYSDSSNYS